MDASVAAKWVLPEADSDRAMTLLGHRLVSPDLLLTECANILWKSVRRGDVRPDEAAADLASLAAANVAKLPAALLLGAALRRAVTLDHPVYDCLYLEASAVTGLPLVTADRRLACLSGDGAEVILLSDLTLPPVA